MKRGPGPKRDPKKLAAWQQRSRKKGINKRNKKRRAKEWARAYGSKSRVVRMKMRDCDGCGRVATEDVPNVNAHLFNGGTGRKSDWAWVVTLCPMECHPLLDDKLGSPARFLEVKGVDLVAVAKRLAVEIPA